MSPECARSSCPKGCPERVAIRTQLVPAAAPEEGPQPAALEQPPRVADRDHHLDRTHLPPPPTTTPTRPIDSHRIRDHHDHTGHPGRLTQPVTKTCSSPDRRQIRPCSVSYTHLRAHETVLDLVCRL